jgi:hypothetical protein
MPAKIPAVEAGALLGGRGWCGRGEEDGREEGAAAPLEALRALPLVAGDRVASALWRFEALGVGEEVWMRCAGQSR